MQLKVHITLLLLFISFLSKADNHVVFLNIVTEKDKIILTPQLQFNTSAQIKEAIDNGIRVHFIAKTQLFENKPWWFDKTISNKKITLEVSYFTLGKLYIVKNLKTGEQQGFNDYEQIWQSFDKLMVFSFAKKNIDNNTLIKTRIMLDKGALPIAMQINVLFNANWDINTPWFQQQVLQN